MKAPEPFASGIAGTSGLDADEFDAGAGGGTARIGSTGPNNRVEAATTEAISGGPAVIDPGLQRWRREKRTSSASCRVASELAD